MRTTDLGYPVLSDNMHEQVFGKDRMGPMKELSLKRTKNLLKKYNVSLPVDYPQGLYNGDLPLPELYTGDLKSHFEEVARQQVGKYKELGDALSEAPLPKIPQGDQVVLRKGWTRYEWVEGEGFITEQVPYPSEKAFTFDTETFVHDGAFPIIGTALSSKAAYIWLASELIDPTLPREKWDQYNLIPIGEDRFVVGHNISYDRVRAQEGYSLGRTEPENFYFDTLSAHIGVSGLASGQRWLYLLAAKDPDNLTEEEKRKLRYAPKWLDKGSTNSLVQCYNFHVYEVRKYFGDEAVRPLDQGDKVIREIFVKATHLSQITALINKAVDYAVKDALYTAELFQALWPKYLDSTPSMVGLCGHYHLNGSVVPLVPEWPEWIKNTEKVYHEHNNEMTELCKKLMWDTYGEWKRIVESEEDFEEGLKKAMKWVQKDPWNTQLDWTVQSMKGKYAKIPNWMRDYIREPDKNIGVKSILAHLLLKLKWEGQPLNHTKENGWCFQCEEEGMAWKRVPHPSGKEENCGGVLSKDFVKDMETGRLSSDLPEAKRALDIANATSFWTSVRKRVMDRIFMKVDNPHGSETLVTLPEILCHGTVTRRTVESLMATMCSTKPWRIGTELKTRIQAPEGWKIISADYDGQEMQIASIYSDKWEGGFVGCSPMGYNVLSGSKENGTDPHTALARAIFPELYKELVWDRKLGVCNKFDEKPDDSSDCTQVDGYWLKPIDKKTEDLLKAVRDLAKIVGFAILYGGSVRALTTPIRRTFPNKNQREVKDFALRALASKKGIFEKGVYVDGSDSGAFNLMEQISMHSKVPQLPCLGTKISTAMRPAAVGSDFKTGRTNWTIQASGAEILSLTLTAVAWLAKEFKVPYRFVISIHDELHFMTPERFATQFAVVFQMAHLYTWARFHTAVGIPELPLSRAFFSTVAIDNRIRKSPKECTVTPSNPGGKEEPPGTEYSMSELSEIGAVNKLTLRKKAISQGLI